MTTNKKRWILADGITHEVIRVYDTKETAEQAAFNFLCNEGYEPYLYEKNETVYATPHHEYDDDGCCIHCGFDGAEWHHWRNSTYEGRAMMTPPPPCKAPDPREDLDLLRSF